MSRRSSSELAFFILMLVYTASIAQGLYPDIPTRQLPAISRLPQTPGLVLEVKTVPISGDPIWTSDKKGIAMEIAVTDLKDGKESRWDLPPNIPGFLDRTCGICEHIASWADDTRQLLLSFSSQIFLISADGNYAQLNLKMPGKLQSHEPVGNLAITRDGRRIAYSLDYWDKEDKGPTARNRRYEGLFYQYTSDSQPIQIAEGETVYLGGYKYMPAWSPNGQKIAYVSAFSRLIIADVSGTQRSSNDVPYDRSGEYDKPYITEIRWSPDSRWLGVVVKQYRNRPRQGQPIERLYIVDADGKEVKRVKFPNLSDASISTFAWSPDSREIVFRSDFQMKEICSFNVSFYIMAGRSACRYGYHLFRGSVDGASITKVSIEPDFRKSQLFWIQ